MLKKISSLGTVLNKTEQQFIKGGGLSVARCNSPYFTEDGVCESGDHPHPIYGHCICCVGS